jgi:alkylation response protein AidB-like acyl-CoA dehydrogenase
VDFLISEDRVILKDSIRKYAIDRIKPLVEECDESQELPLDIIRELGEMGLLGILIEPEFGGAGMKYQDYIIILEELARIDPAISLVIAAHNSLAVKHIRKFGSEEQKQKFLEPLVSGDHLGCWGLTEPGSGSDAAALTAFAEDKGDHYLLNGTKAFITSGSHAKTMVSLVKTDKEAKGVRGVSALIIEADSPGFSVAKKENKLGVRASDTVQIAFQDVEVPKDNLIGKEGEGFYQAMNILDGGRISIAALAVGLAQGAMDLCLQYVQERIAFGKPIIGHQGIQFKIADIATDIDAARLLTQRAAWIKDQKRQADRESAMAKYFAGEAAVRISSEAVQIFGGYGFVKEYGVEKFMRDARLTTIGEGTSEIMKIVISRTFFDMKA